MKPGTGRHDTRMALLTRRNARRVSAVGSVLGVLVITSATLAPQAAAVDVQSKEWYLDAMGADDIWKISTGKGVKVAVIDGGVNPATTSLKGQVLVDEVPASVSYHVTHDNSGHGTSMAEIIAGTGAGGGIKGLAPDAKIIPFRVDTGDLRGSDEISKTPEVAKAIRAAADGNAKIINMSLGGGPTGGDVEGAVKYAVSKGKLLFASIGNDGDKGNMPSYPANYPGVIGVSAIDKSGTVGKFSTYGDYVDLAAPGLHIPSWCDGKFNEYCDSDGTSPASAIASASAALVWSAHPDWTANQVLRTLIDTAARDWPKNKPSKYLGYGGVRPRRVLINKDINPGPANVDPLAKENGVGTSATSSPSDKAPSGKPSKDAGSANGPTSAAAKDTDSGGDTQTWVIIGAVAAVLVIGGAGFAVLRARRNA